MYSALNMFLKMWLMKDRMGWEGGHEASLTTS